MFRRDKLLKHLADGADKFWMIGQGSPSNVRIVRAAPSDNDFKQYPPLNENKI